MSDYGDRRKEARKLIVEFTLVYDSKKGKLLGYLRDLTMSGVQVSGNKKLDVGADASLSIELPNDLATASVNRLQVRAKVARCITLTENPASYAIGFEFTDLQIKEQDMIEKLLERYNFRHKLY